MAVIFFIVVGLQTWTSVMGYSTGAPADRCANMTPGHGVPAQTSQSPYTIVTNSNGTFWSNKTITVTIQGPDYLGLLLQARTASNVNALGTWQAAPTNTKHLECSGNAQGAITHANNNAKTNLTVYTWTPPASLDSVFFTATVVRSRTVFWVELKSATLTNANATGNPATANPGSANPGSAADPKMTFTPALLLLALITSTILFSS